MGFEWLPADKYYKRHFICTACCKGFKKQSELEIINQSDRSTENVKCPECTGPMQQVHYDFEVPSKRDKKQWKALAQKYSDK